MTAQTQARKVEVTLTDNRPKRHIGLIVTLVIFGIILLGAAATGWLLLQEGKPAPSVIRGSVLTEKLNLVKKVSEKDGVAVFEHLVELPFGTDMELIDDIRQTINQDSRFGYGILKKRHILRLEGGTIPQFHTVAQVGAGGH
jgi:hypothetical protein